MSNSVNASDLVAQRVRETPDVPWEQHPNDVRLLPLAPGEEAETTLAACPVCDATAGRLRYRVDRTRLHIAECGTCGLASLHPRPTPAEIESFYPPNYYGATGAKFQPLVEKLVRIVGARRARLLAKGLEPGARVLDIGCGRGVLLSSLADRGLETHGFEISDYAAEGADPRVQLRIGSNLAEVDYPDGHFDLVVLWHVFEHMPDPVETLREIRRILKPGGRVVIAVPNHGSLQSRCTGRHWFHLDPPRHLFHYSARTLRQLLDREGFAPEAAHHFSLRQNPFGWVQSLLNAAGSPRNGLYASLLRKSDSKRLFGWWTRLGFRLAYWIGMPVALGVSLLTTLLRSGATVSIVARTPVEPDSASPETLDTPTAIEEPHEPAAV